MKKILIGLLALGSITAFANVKEDTSCVDNVMEEISLIGAVDAKMQELEIAQTAAVENGNMEEAMQIMEQMTKLYTSVEDLSKQVCE
jgi:hypothetical protein